MPLPNILTGKAKRCRAKCKARGDRCRNPAAYKSSVCRNHGARRPETIMRGASHPQYRHGQETRDAKAERHEMAVFFCGTENAMLAFGLMAPGSTPARGRNSCNITHRLADLLLVLTANGPSPLGKSCDWYAIYS